MNPNPLHGRVRAGLSRLREANGQITMHPRPALIVLIVAAACVLGCDQPSDAPTHGSATQAVDATPEPMMPTHIPIDGAPALTEDSLRAIEQKYSCRLPDDYREFLLKYNGGFPTPDCVGFEEAGRMTASDVFCFFAIGDERAWASMEWHLDGYSGRLPEDTIPIARDSCGNLWLISVGRDNSGSVYFWDHGSFDTFDETDLANWPRVATSFTAFRGILSTYDATADSDVVPSRYSLVNQAAAGTARNNAGFSTRANPGFVWHCDCDDTGKVSMQFVQYKVHALVTHTDGYSRLRAIKGAIQEGPTRLPE